jgi:hypothetical protein
MAQVATCSVNKRFLLQLYCKWHSETAIEEGMYLLVPGKFVGLISLHISG